MGDRPLGLINAMQNRIKIERGINDQLLSHNLCKAQSEGLRKVGDKSMHFRAHIEGMQKKWTSLIDFHAKKRRKSPILHRILYVECKEDPGFFVDTEHGNMYQITCQSTHIFGIGR